MVKRNVAPLELLSGPELLLLDSCQRTRHSPSPKHAKARLNKDNAPDVLLIEFSPLLLQHPPQHPLQQPRASFSPPFSQSSSEFVELILSLNLLDTLLPRLLHQSARLHALIVLDQSAEPAPVELHAPGPAHRLPLLFEMSPDCPLDDRGLALHQVEGAPAGECSGEGMVSLQSL